ncbi:MAG: GNAT family N-acetyltransferase [Ruminococcaceae bacterium]|nr:GNAT family N-acetyltransferase [Oscillospiraceae bacterium]
MSIKILPLTKDKIPAAAVLEKECLDTAWSENAISEFLSSDTAVYLYCETEGILSGILSATLLFGEAEIENIAVSPDFRRRGIGKDLVNALKEKCEKIFLLVKEDNYGAIAFYASMGFVKTGVRRRYYHGKDAYVMELKV